MRSIMIALVLAAGFGLAGTSSSLSAPMSGKVLGDLARAEISYRRGAVSSSLPALSSFRPQVLAPPLVVSPA